jgi:hypothetical protein
MCVFLIIIKIQESKIIITVLSLKEFFFASTYLWINYFIFHIFLLSRSIILSILFIWKSVFQFRINLEIHNLMNFWLLSLFRYYIYLSIINDDAFNLLDKFPCPAIPSCSQNCTSHQGQRWQSGKNHKHFCSPALHIFLLKQLLA